jgi:hypothetical protein
MPKKKTPELPPKEQFKRFQELGVDENTKAVEKSFGKLAKPRSLPPTSIPKPR